MEFLYHLFSDGRLAVVELERAQEVVDLTDRQRADLMTALAAERHRQGFRSKTGPLALRTRDLSEVLFVTLSSVVLSLIHISEPTRLRRISYAVFCLKKK